MSVDINAILEFGNDLEGDIDIPILKGEKGDSVDVDVIKDTKQEYVLKFTTPHKEIESPNLKAELIRGEDYMTPSDMEEIYDEIHNSIKPLTNEEIESIFH